MKKLLLILLFLVPCFAFSQSEDYKSRGVKAFLVNYGAINKNPFYARFAARRFVLIDEANSVDIKRVLNENPNIPILEYKDIIALYDNMDEYSSVNQDEYAFLHSCEPSCLTIYKGSQYEIYWLADSRVNNVLGYRLYWSSDSLGVYQPLDAIVNQTKLHTNLPIDANYLKVCSVLSDSSETTYGIPVKINKIAYGSTIAPRIISHSKGTLYDTLHFEADILGNIVADSIYLSIDENADNYFWGSEISKLIVNGSKIVFDKIIKTPDEYLAGYEFVITAYKDSKAYQFPDAGKYMSSINNRLRNGSYGGYIMNVGNPTWHKAYIQQVLKGFDEYAYNGLFEDDTYIDVTSNLVDSYPPYNYDKYVWSENIYDFLDSIKLAISPKKAYFNGLYTYRTDSLLLHADGGMTEGFAHNAWSGYVGGESWKGTCKLGLYCSHQYYKQWLCLGGVDTNNAEQRMYVLSSYLLVADSLSMLAVASSYAEFDHYPEFDIPLGKPLETANLEIDDLKHEYSALKIPYYSRKFENGMVVVNPNRDNFIVLDSIENMNNVFPDYKKTVNGGRLFCYAANDTIYPLQAKIFLTRKTSGNFLVSPSIDSIKVDYIINSENETEVSISAFISDSSSITYKSNYKEPLYVTAEFGSIGGPKEIRLLNDGSKSDSISSKYSAKFTVPIGILAEESEFPVIACSNTGLIAVKYGKISIKEIDSLNKLPNFSFEIDADDDCIPDLWVPYVKGFVYDTSTNNYKTGKRSVYVKNDSMTEYRGIYTRYVLEQSIAEDILISGWSKAVNVSGNKDYNYSIYVDAFYQDGTPLYGEVASFNSGTHEWEYSEKIIKPEKPIKYVNIYCLFRNHTGEAWFDNLSLSKYIEPNYISDNNKNENRICVYPNPVSITENKSLKIRLNNINENELNLKLYDIVGNQVSNYSNNSIMNMETAIDINNLQPGVYFLKVISSRKVYIEQFIIIE